VTGRIVTTTERLVLREFTDDDAAFYLELVNSPGWIAAIADFGVRDLAAARERLHRTVIAAYDTHGFGFWRVELRSGATPIGLCGVIHRDGLDHPDLGYALLEPFWGNGYAREAARASIAVVTGTYRVGTLCAFTAPDNPRSAALLLDCGFRDEGLRQVGDWSEPSRYYLRPAPAGEPGPTAPPDGAARV
jgi:[ribosomal protein S5]-alanine N-acetyltransferase